MKWKDSNDENETGTGEEIPFEEDYSPLRTRKLNFGSRLTSLITRPGLLLVIIFLILMGILAFTMGSGGSDKTLLSTMDQRIQQLESKIATLEGIRELVTDLDNNRQTTQPLMVRLDRLETSFAKRISDLEQNIEKLQTKPVATMPKQNPTPVVESRSPQNGTKTHVVKKGETLYSIGKQYGISVNQLMTLNKLSKGAVINPGQALKVK